MMFAGHLRTGLLEKRVSSCPLLLSEAAREILPTEEAAPHGTSGPACSVTGCDNSEHVWPPPLRIASRSR